MSSSSDQQEEDHHQDHVVIDMADQQQQTASKQKSDVTGKTAASLSDLDSDSNNIDNSKDDDPHVKRTKSKIESEWARRDRQQDEEVHRQLQKAIVEAGTWAYGIIAVEVWALQKNSGDELYAPQGGLWMDPLAHRGHCDDPMVDCKACRLTNNQLRNYIPPDPVAVGEGLPGILWQESGSDQSKSLHWRHLPELIDDPHRQWNVRMQWWVECGITWAAGVPFYGHGNHKGIIIYLARSGIALPLLKSPENEDYLRAVSGQIGSLYAVSTSRKQMIAKRRAERDAVLRRIKIKLLAVVRFGGSLKVLTENEVEKKRQSQEFSMHGGSSAFGGKSGAFGGHSDSFDVSRNSNGSFDPWRSWKGNFRGSFNPQQRLISFQNPLVSLRGFVISCGQKLATTLIKTKGKGVRPPPFPAWEAAWIAGIGSFITLLTLARLNVLLVSKLGGDYSIVLGPMGAFVTLMYGLTAAPAAQPLNAMVGQAIAITISLLISMTNMELYLKQAVATGLAVFVMVKMGLTHPPAGASALVYASGNFGWTHMATSMLGVFIAILTGAILNNVHSKRQYPTFWGVWYVAEQFGVTEWKIKV